MSILISEIMPRREVHFAGSALAIEYQGERAAHIVDYLYRDMPESGQAAPHITCRLQEAEQEGNFELYFDGDLERSNQPEEEIAAYLLDRTCFHLADRSQGGLVLHAAGLAWRGRGLLLPGVSGNGKSTLSAWLVSRGFDYLTDELVFIPEDTAQFHGLTRPLNLKNTARELLKEILAYQEKPDDIVSSRGREITPPRVLNGGDVLSAAQLRLIVFPRFQQEGELQLTPLSKARAGLGLMECLINARNLTEHGFPHVTRLARATPAYELVYGGFDQIEGVIEDNDCPAGTLDIRVDGTYGSPSNASCDDVIRCVDRFGWMDGHTAAELVGELALAGYVDRCSGVSEWRVWLITGEDECVT